MKTTLITLALVVALSGCGTSKEKKAAWRDFGASVSQLGYDMQDQADLALQRTRARRADLRMRRLENETRRLRGIENRRTQERRLRGRSLRSIFK